MVFNLREVQRKLDLAITELAEITQRIETYTEQIALLETDFTTEWQPPSDGSLTPAYRLVILCRAHDKLHRTQAIDRERKSYLQASIQEYQHILETYNWSYLIVYDGQQ